MYTLVCTFLYMVVHVYRLVYKHVKTHIYTYIHYMSIHMFTHMFNMFTHFLWTCLHYLTNKCKHRQQTNYLETYSFATFCTHLCLLLKPPLSTFQCLALNANCQYLVAFLQLLRYRVVRARGIGARVYVRPRLYKTPKLIFITYDFHRVIIDHMRTTCLTSISETLGIFLYQIIELHLAIYSTTQTFDFTNSKR